MLIDISVGSRFHAFDLARELDRAGMMRTLHTGYPRFSSKRFGLRSDMIRSVFSYEPLNRLHWLMVRKHLLPRRLDHLIADYFDRTVARRLRPGAAIFIGWSGLCRRSLDAARRLGMITIVERGSAHIDWQRDILQEESDLTGIRCETPSAPIVAREVSEYAKADYITVPSQFAGRTFESRGIPSSRLLINPYGVDLAFFQPETRLERPTGPLRVLHVGRVSVQKGAHYLVEAVGQVAAARLTLVGGVEPGIETRIARPHVTSVGSVPARRLPEFYAASDVFCLLSLQDGFAMVIAQAMAMGLPIITTVNTGAAELIEDYVNGFVVPVRDPGAVAAKLRWLVDHPAEAARMGRANRKKLETGFDWASYGRRAQENYRRVLAARATPSKS